LSWNDTIDENDANISSDNFFKTFKDLHDLFFQAKKVRFNKNIHKKEPWITKDLLTSRLTKLKLERNHTTNPATENWNYFKTYCDIYNRIVRASERQYYCKSLEANSNNLKKTWAILNEVLKKGKSKL
jgi:hypothetical protein